MFVLASLFTQKNALRLVKTKQDFFSNAKEEEFHYLYGVNPVEAAIHAKKRILTTLFISDSENVELNSKITNLMKHARSIELPIVFTSKDKLSRIVKGQPHQNIVLKCSPLPVRKWILHSFKFGFGVYVFCDKISDPQNFGAIFRSSLFFGARTIFTGKKGHCPLNETVSKTSSGAMQMMQTVIVEKSEQFLTQWKEQQGIIVVTGVDKCANIVPIQEINAIKQEKKLGRILVVIGSEGEGVSPHILKHADYVVSILGKGNQQFPASLIDSLNVNSALSVVLYELTKKSR